MFKQSKERAIFEDTESDFNELGTLWLKKSKEGNSLLGAKNQDYKDFYKNEYDLIRKIHGEIWQKLISKHQNSLQLATQWHFFIGKNLRIEHSVEYGHEAGFSQSAHEEEKTLRNKLLALLNLKS